jgi:hypothetical protein
MQGVRSVSELSVHIAAAMCLQLTVHTYIGASPLHSSRFVCPNTLHPIPNPFLTAGLRLQRPSWLAITYHASVFDTPLGVWMCY